MVLSTWWRERWRSLLKLRQTVWASSNAKQLPKVYLSPKVRQLFKGNLSLVLLLPSLAFFFFFLVIYFVFCKNNFKTMECPVLGLCISFLSPSGLLRLWLYLFCFCHSSLLFIACSLIFFHLYAYCDCRHAPYPL